LQTPLQVKQVNPEGDLQARLSTRGSTIARTTPPARSPPETDLPHLLPSFTKQICNFTRV
jgi:hypothetical protein